MRILLLMIFIAAIATNIYIGFNGIIHPWNILSAGFGIGVLVTAYIFKLVRL